MARIISRSSVVCLLACAALLVAACARAPQTEAPAAPEPAPSPQVAAIRIVVLGDSLAAGLGLAEGEAFPAVLEVILRGNGHSVDVVNAGVSGDTSAGGLSRVDWVLQQPTDILVIELGGNDALRGQDLENTESNLRQIVRRGRVGGTRVVLLGMDVPTNYGPAYSRQFSEMYVRIANEEDAALVPAFVREVGTDPILLQPDGLHPTAEGQRRLAEILAPHLESFLARSDAPGADLEPPPDAAAPIR
ncbi:MAG: arylesterase [Acidobacteria bacterium]|nr:arylesterase [Candidatus Sulfomarinibacter sp. MAG AM2]